MRPLSQSGAGPLSSVLTFTFSTYITFTLSKNFNAKILRAARITRRVQRPSDRRDVDKAEYMRMPKKVRGKSVKTNATPA
jgi:hypothetical protein